MDHWTLTDWSEGTKGLERLLARQRRGYLLLAAAYVAVGIVDLVLAKKRGHRSFLEDYLVGVGPMIAWMTIFGKLRPSIKDPKNLAGIQPDLPGSVTQYPAAISYKRGMLEYGVDRGVVMFADGTMVFQGVRSRFSFGGSLHMRTARGRWPRAGTSTVHYTVANSKYSVTISPSEAFAGLGTGMNTKFDAAFKQWKAWDGPKSNDRITPPLNPHQASMAIAPVLVLLAAATAFWLYGYGQIFAYDIDGPADEAFWHAMRFWGSIPLAALAGLAVVRAVSWSILSRRLKTKSYGSGYGGVTLPRVKGLAQDEPVSTQTQGELDVLHQEL